MWAFSSNTQINPQIFFFFVTRFIFVGFFLSLASQNSIWNTKRNFSLIFFLLILKLSRWLIYSIKIFSADFMSYYQLCTTGTSLLCSIYVFILHTGRPTKSKTCFIKPEWLMLVSVRENKKNDFFLNSTFTQNLPFGWTQHFHSYKQLLPSTKSAWDGGHWIFKSLLLFLSF